MWIDLLAIYLVYRLVLVLAIGWDWYSSRLTPRVRADYQAHLDRLLFPQGRPPQGAGEPRRPPSERG